MNKNSNQAELVMLEGIRICFRMLLPLKPAVDRKSFIHEIEEGLDISVM